MRLPRVAAAAVAAAAAATTTTSSSSGTASITSTLLPVLYIYDCDYTRSQAVSSSRKQEWTETSNGSAIRNVV